MNNPPHPSEDAPISTCVAQVMEDVIRRRSGGDEVSDDEVIAKHPELMPELGAKLRALRLVEQANRIAAFADDANGADAAALESCDTVDGRSSGPANLPAESIAGYQLIREIHRGSQGVVYQALQKSTNRKVAIKIMREGPFADPGDKARFEREVQILGRLQHPNIVGIHDSGSVSGVVYFVMDYVPGQPLDVYVARSGESSRSAGDPEGLGTQGPPAAGERAATAGSMERFGQHTVPDLSIQSTLRLFAKICEAVNAAHLQGIIHRDLKPGNIRVDPSGEPHILDFGLAKVSAFDRIGEGDSPARTLTGQFIGSLPWASPEQAEGQPSKIDLRTDVYSLGVILYQMLTGRFPYKVVGNMRDVLDRILKAEPAKPSTIRRQINDEIETIVLKCLSKERERRYQTAGELARDIRRYLAGEPIEAKRDSAFYVLRKQLLRHRGQLAFGILLLTVLVASSIVAWTLYAGSQHRLWTSYISEAHARRHTDQPGRRNGALAVLSKAAKIRVSREVRDEAIATLAMSDIVTGSERAILPGMAVRVSPSLKYVALFDESGHLVVQDFGSNKVLLDFGGRSFQRVRPTFSNDDRLVTWSDKTECQVWDIESGRLVSRFPQETFGQTWADFRSDNRVLAVGTAQGHVQLHDIETHETRTIALATTRIRRVGFNPGGDKLIVVSNDDSDVIVVEVESGRITDRLSHPEEIAVACWSADGRMVATGCDDGNIYTWDMSDPLRARALSGHIALPIFLAFCLQGSVLCSHAYDGTSRFWDLHLGTTQLTLPYEVCQVTPDGKRIGYVIGSQPPSLGSADILESDVLTTLHPAGYVRRRNAHSIAIARDDRIVFSGGSHSLQVWDLRTKAPLAMAATDPLHAVLLRKNDSELVTSAVSTGLSRWPIQRQGGKWRIGPPVRVSPPSWQCLGASLAADGATLAVAVNRREIALFDLGNSDAAPKIIGRHPNAEYVGISPDAKWVASGGRFQGPAGKVHIWSTDPGELATTMAIPNWQDVKFSPDGRWLVISTIYDHEVWEVGTWQLVSTFPQSPDQLVAAAAFTPSSDMLALIVDDRNIDLVDVHTWNVFARLECPERISQGALTFNTDGTKLLVANGLGHTLHVWDLRALRRRLAEIDLDWDLPPFPPAEPLPPSERLQVELDVSP